MNLREQIEKDLAISIENGGWGLPVELTDPDGKKYNTSANSPDQANPLPLMGQVLYSTIRVLPETGEEVVANKPAVTLRRSSLFRVPKSGESWYIKFPTDPSLTAELEKFVLTSDKATEGGKSIGFINLYPTRVIQS